MPSLLLYVVLKLRDDDIFNCVLATYDRQLANDACTQHMDLNANVWVRIVTYPCAWPAGTRVWVSFEEGEQFTDMKLVSIDDDEELIPQGVDWTDDLVIS